ncbi:hypothetical protein BS47DRAFT_534584 [Hydnum rufescens UP504]|uniref:DNA-directed DNA polymerase n=1 Tax=Hydnum rufescens UP504 TaxID=1448309 RepID=A0A9P6AGM1_9AGAM|nr:hypothetical protein BS47DRAFT_534584 [Hydnum rufescens UP504]
MCPTLGAPFSCPFGEYGLGILPCLPSHAILMTRNEWRCHSMTSKSLKSSCIGRFRRSKLPIIGRQGTNLAGRDLTSHSAKGMITSTTWSLTADSSTDPPTNQSRGQLYPTDFFHFVCMSHALPYIRHKTLTGGHSEHLVQAEANKAYGEPGSSTKGKGKNKNKKSKDTYKGGIVLEPEHRLWDTYILVMDYNSLYPSIIQEYNSTSPLLIKWMTLKLEQDSRHPTV